MKVIDKGALLLLGSLFLLLAFFLSSFSPPKIIIPSLAATDKPIYTCGGEGSGHFYKEIWKFIVSKNGYAYVWDAVNFDHIDVYDDTGRFMFEFGRRGQGPGELQTVACGAIDSGGNIWIDDASHKSLKVFSAEGKFKEEVLLPEEISRSWLYKMLFNSDDELYIACETNSHEFSIFKFNPKENRCQLVHKQTRGPAVSGVVKFFPDIALDNKGNLYVTDVFDYKIYVYSPDGKFIRAYESKKAKKELILDSDFNIFSGDLTSIVKFPGYEMIMEQLKGPSRYFPVVFGLNIDQGRIFVWTSERDSLNRYIVDIYDLNFRKLGRACYFNMIRGNLAQIVGGKLYIPSIENYDVKVTGQLGRISLFNVPERLNIYPVRDQ